MKDEELLRIELSEEELQRIEKAAAARGLDPEDWARNIVLEELRRRREGPREPEED